MDNQYFINKILEPSEREKTLLRLLYTGECSEEAAAPLFEGLDPDVESSHFLLMLAHYGRLHRWAFFPAEIKARTQGIQQFYQVRNTTLLPGLIAYLKELSARNIEVMFIKGMAMKAYYQPSVPRIMSDADILVRKDRYREARLAAREMGFEIDEAAHSADMRKDMASIDLHWTFTKNMAGNSNDTWNQAIRIKWQDLDIYVPSPEYTMVLIFDNEFYNVIEPQGMNRKLKWMMDASIVSKQVDWFKADRIAESIGALEEFRLMAGILHAALPECMNDRYYETIKDFSLSDQKARFYEKYYRTMETFFDENLKFNSLQYFFRKIKLARYHYELRKDGGDYRIKGGFIGLLTDKTLKKIGRMVSGTDEKTKRGFERSRKSK